MPEIIDCSEIYLMRKVKFNIMPTPGFKCPQWAIKCPGRIYQCVEIRNLCDGRKHCYIGSDESPEFCEGLYKFLVTLSIFLTSN